MEEKVEGGNSDSSTKYLPSSRNMHICEWVFMGAFICTGILSNGEDIVPASKIYVDDNGKVNMEQRNRHICEE